MYSEGDEVGENCKTILLKSLLLQDITAAIQRQSPGALRLPTCLILAVLKAFSLLLTVRQRTRMASFLKKIALPLSPLVMKKEHHAVSSLILFGIFDFGYDRAPFFSLSLFFACSPTAMHSLSLSFSL